MIDFNLKYEISHSEIQRDSQLVSTIYCIARAHGLKKKSSNDRYVGIGRFGQIYLGVDLSEGHVAVFGHILAKMRLLYDLSDGNVDLSKVYAQLDDHLEILSEDVSYGAGLFLDNTPIRHLDLGLLTRAFDDTKFELERTTFWAKTGEVVRKPIIDLDHVRVKPEFEDRIKQWNFDYELDPRFLIKESR